jgi:hypothetical protein
MVSYNYYPFSTAPAPFDVVWSRFPFVEQSEIPGPKARPALVRQAFADQDGNPWVEVVYGTSKDPYSNSLLHFSIVTIAEMNMCGLKQATRFDLNRMMKLPWSREFFECLGAKPTPIIGHMPEYEIKKLQTQIAYLQQALNEEAQQIEANESDDCSQTKL